MNLHGIDLNLLVAFEAIMVERSVTRAGIRIGRTQPAMSAALLRLRALLKDELFVRGTSGLQPTQRALELAEPVSRALADIQRALEVTQQFDPKSSSLTLNLGLAEHPMFVVLPQLVKRLHVVAPSVILRVRAFTNRDDAVAMLDSGEVDITIGVPPTISTGRILSRPLFEEQFVCAVRKNHPALTASRLTLKTFVGLSHLLVSPENDRFGHVDTALNKIGLKRRIAITLPHMYAAPGLLACSDLISTLMEGAVRAADCSRVLKILDPPLELAGVPFVMCWHRRNEAHSAQRWFRDCISALQLLPGRETPVASKRQGRSI
jgi:DNA-binding transcriptional LysR family regulator